jgi:hypothetical protein
MEDHYAEEGESLNDEQLDTLARLYMLRNFPGRISVGLSEHENETLDAFLAKASNEQIEQVGTRGKWLQKYFTYTSIDSLDKEKEEIEREMEANPAFRQYIEKTQLWALTEQYAMWRYGIKESIMEPDTKVFDMTDEDIYTFFNLLDEYPEVVDGALAAMTSEIRPGPYKNSKLIIKENETEYKSEREKLLELRDYFTGKMTAAEKSNFHDEIIDNPAFQPMFTKIQNALR